MLEIDALDFHSTVRVNLVMAVSSLAGEGELDKGVGSRPPA